MSEKKPVVFPTNPKDLGKPTVFPTGGGQAEAEAHASGVSQAEMLAAQQMLANTQKQIEEMQARKDAIQAAPLAAVPSEQPISPLAGTKYAPDMVAKHGTIMTPKWDSPYDLIPLPSKGKLYKGVKDRVKVAYMTGSDENILTSPNLIESGDFLEILISRNILEPNLEYNDLHIGDRNAIMIWLRGTAFGNMYPITVYSKTGEIIEDVIDLSQLKYIPLGAEPDGDGLFEFICPNSGDLLKFKLQTVGDESFIEDTLVAQREAGVEINNRSTLTLSRQIKSVNGNSDPAWLSNYIGDMRLVDIKAFRAYVNEIESGIDLKIEVKAAGGESVTTFLPINLRFFWPDI